MTLDSQQLSGSIRDLITGDNLGALPDTTVTVAPRDTRWLHLG